MNKSLYGNSLCRPEPERKRRGQGARWRRIDSQIRRLRGTQLHVACSRAKPKWGFRIGSKHHQRTLPAIFAQPVSSNIRWREIEAPLKSLGATLSERAGSRVAVLLNDRVAVFHRPHPSPGMDKNAVRDLRRFLENAGVKP